MAIAPEGREPSSVENLEGTVRKIIFREAGGYTVAQLAVEGRSLPVVVVGQLLGVHEGERLAVSGEWTRHPRFGEQLRVASFRTTTPSSTEGLVRYLGSGLVSGLGPALAERLVRTFGAELFAIVERDPARLTEVEGIGPKRAEAISRALAEQRAVREVMVFLQGLALGPGLATRIYRAWGDRSIDRLRSDPYALVREVEGIGFATADAIAQRLGLPADSPSRREAGLLHVLWIAAEEGNTVLPEEELLARAGRFLDTEGADLAPLTEGLVQRGVLASTRADAAQLIGLPGLVAAEEGIARSLRALLGQRPRAVPAEILSGGDDLSLTEEQGRAVGLALAGPLVVITGGPGTGKTTILRVLVRALRRLEVTFHLCAPTGRAAKRLAEATAAPACTVHRLLGYGGGRFAHGRQEPLAPAVVVVDEASMLDASLGNRLLAALGPGSSLVLVGDADQLPSVGPGNVLADVIASGVIPVVRLGTIFRQAAESRIVQAAHRILGGELPQASPAGACGSGELHLVRAENPQRAQELVLELCVERIPRVFGLDPWREIQVLSPMHRGLAGTVALNGLLQERLNAGGVPLRRRADELRVGDKVMQVRNDYDREVFNGDIGRVAALEGEGGLVVDFEGAPVRYAAEQLEGLTLAYCVSIHKSQGSEYPAVVVPLLTQHFVLLQRNLLYTAITRARTLAVLVCSDEALRLAVQRAEQSRRRTLLAALLGEA